MEVKNGQIWRDKKNGKNHEVVNTGAWTTCATNDPVDTFTYETGGFIKDYELVTLDNIMPGEWVIAVNDKISNYKEGVKYKIVDYIFSGFSNSYEDVIWNDKLNPEKMLIVDDIFEKYTFKPCLPPKEVNMKIYSNAEIMEMMERGEFIGFDELQHKNGEYPAKYDGHSFVWSDGTPVGFRRGDRWTITLVDRWEECTVQEAFEANYKYGTVIKSVIEGVKKETLTLVKESQGVSNKVYNHIFEGTWYKQVRR